MKKIAKIIFDIYTIIVGDLIILCGICTSLLGLVVISTDIVDIPLWIAKIMVFGGLIVAFDGLIRKIIKSFSIKEFKSKFKRQKTIQERIEAEGKVDILPVGSANRENHKMG